MRLSFFDLRTPSRTATRFAVLILLGQALACHAGRPLSVEDAGVNDPGEGHLEAWIAAVEGSGTSLNLAPAWSPGKGVELSASFARSPDRDDGAASAQFKLQLSPPVPAGCHQAAIGGIGWSRAASGASPYVNAVSSCDTSWGALHLNLGARRAPADGWLPTWGVALERPIGAQVAHIEAIGARHEKPTFQAGVRRELDRYWQLDGTIGHSNRSTVFSIGFKRSFR